MKILSMVSLFIEVYRTAHSGICDFLVFFSVGFCLCGAWVVGVVVVSFHLDDFRDEMKAHCLQTQHEEKLELTKKDLYC